MDESIGSGPPGASLSRRKAIRQFAEAGLVAAVATAGFSPLARGGTNTSSAIVHYRKELMMNVSTPAASGTQPTVVLVHGAFADASGWAGVIQRLQSAGISVTATVNPLRSVKDDAAYVASLLQQIPGPVLLVGHSYGGVVITNAASIAGNVIGLVYVAGFAPDEGESLMDIEVDSKDSVLNSSLLPLQYPLGEGTEVEFLIAPEKYHDAFAADLPEEQTNVMAAYQRPASALAFSEASGVPAWTSLPSWAVIPTGDKAAGTDVLRTMASRAGATIVEVEGSHAIMISQPQAVTDHILSALAALAQEAVTA